MLYIIYTSSPTINVQKTIVTSLFADDIAVFIKTSSVPRGKKILEKAIHIIDENLSVLGLELAPSKTKFIHFNKKNFRPGSTEIIIKNTRIKSCHKAKFLGRTFDHKLLFKPHIDTVAQKCSKALNILRFLCGTWWGSSPEILIIFYKSFVCSIIDYGSFIYLTSNKSTIERIEKIQFAAIRIAYGYRRSTPTNIILAESKMISLENRSNFLCRCFLAKSISTTEALTTNTITNSFYIIKKTSFKIQQNTFSKHSPAPRYHCFSRNTQQITYI